MKNKQEPIVIKKIHRLETNLIVILLGILVLGVGLVWIGYSNNKIKALESSVGESLTSPVSVDKKNEIAYYRELSNKTDAAIERIIMIVGSLSAMLSLIGLLLAFKVPMEISKKIEEVETKVSEIKNTADGVKCLSEVFMAYNFNFHSNSSSVSINTNKINVLSKIIKENHDNPSAGLIYMLRAKIYIVLGKHYKRFGNTECFDYYYRMAIKDYCVAVELGENICNSYIALLYKELDDKKNASTYYKKSMSADSTSDTFFINRGIYYRLTGKYKDALKDFSKVIDELNPEEISAYYERFNTYQKMYESEQDEIKKKEYRYLEYKDLEKMTEIDPDYSFARDWLNKLQQEDTF